MALTCDDSILAWVSLGIDCRGVHSQPCVQTGRFQVCSMSAPREIPTACAFTKPSKSQKSASVIWAIPRTEVCIFPYVVFVTSRTPVLLCLDPQCEGLDATMHTWIAYVCIHNSKNVWMYVCDPCDVWIKLNPWVLGGPRTQPADHDVASLHGASVVDVYVIST